MFDDARIQLLQSERGVQGAQEGHVSRWMCLAQHQSGRGMAHVQFVDPATNKQNRCNVQRISDISE